VNGAFSEILNGSAKVCAVALKSNAHSILSQNRIEVKVQYDPRPIGGILNIRLELMPIFSGIGITNRPIAVKVDAEAIDNLTEDQLSTIIDHLSQKLAAEVQSKAGIN
jgi:hypothetical protein